MDYRKEAEELHGSGMWVSPPPQLSDVVGLGACGYTALLLLRKLLGNKRGIILDVGGGDGGFTLRLVRGRDIKLILSDIAFTPLGRFQGDAVQADSLYLPFCDNSFDVILTSDHLEHLEVEDVKVSLSEMNRVLKPEGSLLIHTSSYGYYLRRIGARFGERGRLDRYDLEDGHRCRPTMNEWSNYIAEAGFVIKDCYFYKHLFQPVLRGVKDLFLRGANKGSEKEEDTQEMKENPIVAVMGYLIVLLSLLDVFLFSKIPGGAVVMKLRKLDKAKGAQIVNHLKKSSFSP